MGWHRKCSPVQIMPSLDHITPFSVNVFPNKVVANAPNNNERNRSFYSFVSHLIASLICHTSNHDSQQSSDLTIFSMSFFCSFKIINAVGPDL